jgi:hypothetical protein
MQKRYLFWLTLTLSALLTLIAACGTGTSTSNPTTVQNAPSKAAHPVATVPAGENLYVLDGYTPSGSSSTKQQIVAFHPGSTNPVTLVTLPAGLTSQDHQRLYTATAANGQTTIAILNTRTGKTLHSFAISGIYSTAGQSFENAVISPDGRWLALRQLGQSSNQTTIALVDTQAMSVNKNIQLNGDFYLDATSPHGGIIYLLQYLNDISNHYYVRAYDTHANQLLPVIIADKSELNDPRMIGTALTRQMPRDGDTAYTLYIDTRSNKAFVHILPLVDRPDPGGPNTPPAPQFARCLDLPVGKSPDLLRYYTLTLSPKGDTLYAANGALGIVVEISLSPDYVIFSDNIASQNNFDPGHLNMTSSATTRVLHNGAVFSQDGSMLYFIGVDGIWAVSTADLEAKAHYLAQQAFTGLASSADGRILYAVDPAQGILLLNTATGQTQQVIQGPARTPWGIEWINN